MNFKIIIVLVALLALSCKSKSIRHEGLHFTKQGNIESGIVSEVTAREFDDFAYNFFRFLQLEQFDDAYAMLHIELKKGINLEQFEQYFSKLGLLINEEQFESEFIRNAPLDNDEALDLGFVYYDAILSKYKLNFENRVLYLNLLLSKDSQTTKISISGLVLGPKGEAPHFTHIIKKVERISEKVEAKSGEVAETKSIKPKVDEKKEDKKTETKKEAVNETTTPVKTNAIDEKKTLNSTEASEASP